MRASHGKPAREPSGPRLRPSLRALAAPRPRAAAAAEEEADAAVMARQPCPPRQFNGALSRAYVDADPGSGFPCLYANCYPLGLKISNWSLIGGRFHQAPQSKTAPSMSAPYRLRTWVKYVIVLDSNTTELVVWCIGTYSWTGAPPHRTPPPHSILWQLDLHPPPNPTTTKHTHKKQFPKTTHLWRGTSPIKRARYCSLFASVPKLKGVTKKLATRFVALNPFK